MSSTVENSFLRGDLAGGGSRAKDAGAIARSVVAGSALIGFGAAVLVAWIAQAGSVGVFAAAAIAAAVGVVCVLAIRQVAARNAGAAEPVPAVAAGAPAAVTDGGGNLIAANQAFWRTFARSAANRIDDLAGQAVDEAATRQTVADLLARASGRNASAVIQIRSGDRERAFRVRARQGESDSRIEWTFDDVSEDRAAILRAEAEVAHYRAILDRLPVGVCHLDAGGMLRYGNAQLAQIAAVDGDAAAAGRLRWADLAKEVVAAPDPAQPAVVELRGHDGARRGAAFYEAPLRDGEPSAGSVGALIPRAARGGQGPLAAETSGRFSDAVQRAPVGIALLDTRGTVTYANPAFGRIALPADADTGAERKLRGRALVDFVADDAREVVEAQLGAAVGSRQAQDAIDVAWRAKQTVIVSIVFTPMTDADGAVDSILATVVDITTQRQLEQQFTQAQKMQAVGQLAGGVAHDFNNLLTAMIGFCDLLLARMVPGDQSYEDVDQILQNANRAANLVRQLLAFSRKQTLTPRVVSLTDTVAELGHMLRRLLGEGIELKMIYARDLWPVKVDESQLQHVIINLSVNARDAMSGQGMLTIQTSNLSVAGEDDRVHEAMPTGDYVCIKVTDTGVGIPKEIIDRIWEPFFTTKELGEGTGLGLSTCYGIVKQTGGFIFADSVLGQGSTFSVYLPRHIPAEGTAQPAKEGPRVARDLTGAGRVLLVEDEDAVRLFSTRALKNKGYEVLAANGGEQALDLLDENADTIDLMITDVMMPEMDGPTLIRHVRERIPDIKVICISGYAEDAIRERLADDTEIHFLAKPFNLEDLASMVKEVLNG
ncbi:MAG: response regulator [Alphaproteobacteria bacterium]